MPPAADTYPAEVFFPLNTRALERRNLLSCAQDGDFDAFGRLVGATQAMTFAVAVSVLRDVGLAQDPVLEAVPPRAHMPARSG